MINIKIETERVYSHTSTGMPKFEKYPIDIEGISFDKFLKYLPFKGYVKVEILSVTKDGVEINKEVYERKLNKVLNPVTEPTIEDKYQSEKQRNDELMARIEALESKQPEKQPDKKDISPKDKELKVLRKEYLAKFEKKPYGGWDVETLKTKLSE